MSIRALWILISPGKSVGKVIFSRYFPTVERRTKILQGDGYVAIPDVQEFAESLYGELGRKNRSDKFVESRDTCRKTEKKPVYEVSTAAGKLWPLVVIEQFGVIFCCLPAVEQSERQESPLIQCPGIYVGFSLLLAMMDFLGPCPPGIDENFEKFPYLHLFLSQAAPFGSPVDLSLTSVDAKLHSKLLLVNGNHKQPAWKPILHKGKGTLYFAINENMRAVQYDSPNIPDVYEVYGTVSCRCTLEGLRPDVILTLSYQQDSLHIPMEDFVVNPCVQYCDVQTLSKGAVSPVMKLHSANPHKIRFTPLLEMIALCHYTAKPVPDLPIKGFYQMKGESTVELLVQLRLNEKVKNNFEYCELQMPFFHRGPVIDYEASPNHGQCLLSPDKKILVWNIGQKFPSRSLEILLKATVHFKEYSVTESSLADEQFCVGQNAYAQLFFKIEDYTLSGSWIDPKSIVISPPSKHKVTFVREFQSIDYKIWNSHGDAQMAFSPPRYLLS